MPSTGEGLLAGLALFFVHSGLMGDNDTSFQAARDSLRAAGAIVTVSDSTGRAQFVRIPAPAPGPDPGLSAGDQLDDFLVNYGAVFGIQNHRDQLQRRPERRISPASSLVEMHQTHLGLPVFAGVLKAHFNRNNVLYAVNGTIIDALPASLPLAGIAFAEAGELAIAVVGKELLRQGREVPALSPKFLRELWYHDGLRDQSTQPDNVRVSAPGPDCVKTPHQI